MTFGIQWRLVVLGTVVTLMGLLILLATLNSQKQAAELGARLSQVDLESFRIADRFRDSLRELNNTMQRYGIEREPAVWEEFLKASRKLDDWIDQQKPKLTTREEQEALAEIDAAYDRYQRVAQELQAKVLFLEGKSPSLADYDTFRKASQRLFDLGQNLGKAHYESRKILLAHAGQTLKHLRWSVLASLALLFAFGVALAGVVYRDMIAPLRVKLVQSESFIERHEKLASLGMLAAGVAHEIRNPLTAIKAALFIQQKKFRPGSPEYGDMKLVEREILRLERIVNDFLHFARPTDPDFVTLPAAAVLVETQRLMAAPLAASNIELKIASAVETPIRLDPEQIKQVLINIVQNASDSIGRDGTVILRARPDRMLLSGKETPVVILEVSDSGKGIPPEVEKRLFDPFFTTKQNGTGLGLSIAARIVQKHGGVLQYQTRVNHGTTFGIVLPGADA